MAYSLVYPDGTVQTLGGRVAITRQDNDLTRPESVQAAFSTSFALPDDVGTHKRLDLAQLGTSLSTAPYAGLGCCLEAGGVEVLPGARLALDDYTPRTGYTGKLLAGNKAFYDLLGDKTLRELDLSAFDHDWTLSQVAAGASNSHWQAGYVYDIYDRGLGAPPLPAAGSSRLFEAGYWPTAYARAVWEAIFVGAGVKWSGELPGAFDTALLPATASFGYSEATRAAHRVVAGYAPTAQALRFGDEQNAPLPFTHTLATKVDGSLVLGSSAVWDPVAKEAVITQRGFYDLQADQTVHLFCSNILSGEVAAVIKLLVNGQLVGEVDSIRGSGQLDAGLTALAERQLLQVGDRVQARYQFDKFKGGTIGNGPYDYGWVLETEGRLSISLLSDFPPGGRVVLADWLPEMTQRDFVKGFIQLYGLTQTTDPYTNAALFRRTAAVLDNFATGADWSARRDGSQPAKRSWRLGDFAQRNWFRWKEDDSNLAYAQAQAARTQPGFYWDGDAAKKVAADFAAGYLDNGAGDVSLAATKDVLSLPFAASPVGEAGLLLLPYWKPKAGTDYAADLQVIADAQADGTYSAVEAVAARAKALVDDFDTQAPAPRLCYQLPPAYGREVKLEDDQGNTQQVSMRLSYFVRRDQTEDLDFTRSLLPRYYPHLAAALVRPLVLRPAVRLTAAEVVAFDQLVPVWLEEEGAWFFVNKVDGWEEDEASTPVELIRL
ncbi:hypothetical protein QMK33_19745 [Hymenobacter sp. H14-R3]|uniref:hypothetical protein n=1 Tax=Hymenobacter sp. H14-R3 TaxID=3046308 RepID=UPI0024BB851E|nr:hypothetical protein [Hymenobacter sp. H14-R3]MDJ0367388.1 hypothetical protein [Hymenobacter sp. H14-R3]